MRCYDIEFHDMICGRLLYVVTYCRYVTLKNAHCNVIKSYSYSRRKVKNHEQCCWLMLLSLIIAFYDVNILTNSRMCPCLREWWLYKDF